MRPALRNPAPLGMQQAPAQQPRDGCRRRPADTTEGSVMIKVRTFTTPIKIFATQRELQELDDQVSAFLNEESAAKVYAVGDTTTAGENGETIGLIRTVAYRVDD
jgi:hypothetical protein